MKLSMKLPKKDLKELFKGDVKKFIKASDKGLRQTEIWIQNEARSTHRFKTRTGTAERSIETKHYPLKLKGKIFINQKVAEYPVYLHQGTGVYGSTGRPYKIEPVNKKALRFFVGGREYFSKGHYVKGIKGEPFLKNARDKAKKRKILQDYILMAYRRL